jgi:hypothetical protein
MSSYIFIVASMPLPHSCGIMLLWKQYETIPGLSCGITANFDFGIIPTLLRLDYRLNSSSHRTTCGITANLSDLYSGIDATSTLLWDYAAMKAVWDHTRSFLRHYCWLWLRHHVPTLLWLDCQLDSLSHRTTCGITANLASSPSWLIFIVAPLPLPHYCGNILLRKQYETKLVLVVASFPALHYYYLAFVVLTYSAYLIAVNTSYRPSLGTTDPGIQALIL